MLLPVSCKESLIAPVLFQIHEFKNSSISFVKAIFKVFGIISRFINASYHKKACPVAL